MTADLTDERLAEIERLYTDIEAARYRAGFAANFAIRDLLEALRLARLRENTLESALRRFVEAWWEYEGPDFEPLDAAAGEGMTVLGDVLSLPEASA